MPIQPSLFDAPPPSQEPDHWDQPIEAIPIHKDAPNISLAELVPVGARLELTRQYEIRSIHLSRLLHLLDEVGNAKLTNEQAAQQLAIPSARIEATLTFGRWAELFDSVNKLTRFGKLVLELNPYLDDKGLLWLLHYLLASNANLAVWSLAFDRLSWPSSELDTTEITTVLSTLGNRWSEKTLKKKAPAELRGTLKCYSQEIFSPLGLVTPLHGTHYEFNSNTAVIPAPVWLSSILIYRDRYYPGTPSLETPLIIDGHFSPGRLFRQNQTAARKALDDLHLAGLLSVETRSGLDQVRFRRETTWLSLAAQYLKGIAG